MKKRVKTMESEERLQEIGQEMRILMKRNLKDSFDIFYQVLKRNFDDKDTHGMIFYVTNLNTDPRFSITNKKEITEIRKKLRNRNDPIASFLLAVTYQFDQFLSQEDSKIIEDNLTKAFRQIKSDYKYYYFADFFRHTKRFDSAFKNYKSFIENQKNNPYGIIGLAFCYDEASGGMYLNRKINDALNIIEEGITFIEGIKIKFNKNQIEQRILNSVYYDMNRWKELIIFDSAFQKIFYSRGFDELKTSIRIASSLLSTFPTFSVFLKKDRPPIDPGISYIMKSFPMHILWGPKFAILTALSLIIEFENGESDKNKEIEFFKKLYKINKTRTELIEDGFRLKKEIEALNKYKDYLTESTLSELTKAADGVLTFVRQVDQYKSVKEISKEEEARLMMLLRPASVFDGDFSHIILSAFVRGKEEIKKEILSGSEKIEKLLSEKLKKKEPEEPITEDGDYELLSSGKKRKPLTSEEAEKIRGKNGPGIKKGIFIDDERKDVFVNSKYAVEFKDLMYAMLMHFVMHAGVGGNNEILYIGVWGDAVAAERNRDDAIQQAVKRFRKILKKYNLGKVPELSKSRYSASKTYIMKPKPKYFILRRIEKEKKEE